MKRILIAAGALAVFGACGTVKSKTDGSQDAAPDSTAGDAVAMDAQSDLKPIADAGQDTASVGPSKVAEDLATQYRSVMVVGANLVFNSDTNIFRMPESGGIVSPIVAVGTSERIMGLQADSSYVYYLVRKAGDGGSVQTLMKAPIGGGTATPVVSADCGLLLTSNDTDLFLTRSDATTLSRVGKTGANLVTITTAPAVVRGIAVDSNNLYFGTPDEVRQVPVAGGATKLLFSQVGADFEKVGVVGTAVYFAGSAEVRTVPVGGGTVSLMMKPAGATYVAGLAASSTHLFVLAGQTSTGGCGGAELWRMPRTGGAAESIAMGHPGTCPQNMYLASDAVYLTTLVSHTSYSGEVWKVPL